MGKVGWSDLPEELVDLISNRLSSNIGLVRFRSICKPWRSAVATKKRFLNRFKRNLRPFNRNMTELIPTTLFRITLPYSSSSFPNKGWLIKTRQDTESSKILLLSPLSHQLFTRSNKTLDLFKVGVSDIHQTYNVRYLNKKRDTILHDFSRVVFVDNLVFVVDYKNQIWCCKSGGQSSKWTRIKNEDVGDFSDVILHRGHVYALDLKGAIWWISLSELNISQYGPPTPIEYYEIDDCKDKRLVDYCGDVCVVHRFCKKFRVNWYDVDRTVNFKVYKMDKELVEWVEISSLEDKALIVASDSCFTVVASEYHGCLENAIYFNDDDDGYTFRKGVNGEGVKVFKLDDRSIINTIDSSSESCLEMFSPPFLWKD